MNTYFLYYPPSLEIYTDGMFSVEKLHDGTTRINIHINTDEAKSLSELLTRERKLKDEGAE